MLSLPVAVVLLGSVAAGILDVWKFRIPNLLTLPLVLGGVTYHTLAGGWSGADSGLAQSVLGALVGLSLLAGFYLMGAMGGGDVKLLAGVGAWLGPGPTLGVFLASSLIAGAYAVVLLCFSRGGRRDTLGESLKTRLKQPNRRLRLIPFGAMIGLSIVALISGGVL